MTELERKFTRDMEELCWITKKECGYSATIYRGRTQNLQGTINRNGI